MSDQTELDAAISALQQIAGAAHFTPTGEDYSLIYCVRDHYVQSQALVQLVTAHPELKPEIEAIVRQLSQGVTT
jgi:hypothetical protein